MSASYGGLESSKSENKANTACGQAQQNFFSGSHHWHQPRQWTRKTKAIVLCVVSGLLIIAILAITVPVYFSAKSQSGSPSSTSSTATTPTTAPAQTLPASKTSSIASSSVATPATPTVALPPPPSPSADGVRLVNCQNDTVKSSGFAYYRSAKDGNNGAQPDDYAVSTTNVFAQWENQNRTGYFIDTNTTFWVFVNSTHAPVNAAVGEASNGYRTFNVYKDDGRNLYEKDGAECSSIFYCQ